MRFEAAGDVSGYEDMIDRLTGGRGNTVSADPRTWSSSTRLVRCFSDAQASSWIFASLHPDEGEPHWRRVSNLVASAFKRDCRGQSIRLRVEAIAPGDVETAIDELGRVTLAFDSRTQPLRASSIEDLEEQLAPRCNASVDRPVPRWKRFGLAAVVWLALALVDYFTVKSSAFATIAFVACFWVAARWGR